MREKLHRFKLSYGAVAVLMLVTTLCAMYFKQKPLESAAIEGVMTGIFAWLINLSIMIFAKKSDKA